MGFVLRCTESGKDVQWKGVSSRQATFTTKSKDIHQPPSALTLCFHDVSAEGTRHANECCFCRRDGKTDSTAQLGVIFLSSRRHGLVLVWSQRDTCNPQRTLIGFLSQEDDQHRNNNSKKHSQWHLSALSTLIAAWPR